MGGEFYFDIFGEIPSDIDSCCAIATHREYEVGKWRYLAMDALLNPLPEEAAA